MRRLSPSLGLLAVSLLAALALAESVLRAAGFSFSLAPERVEFGWPDPTILEKSFVPDRELFWVSQGYSQNLETLRGKRPHIVFLGDSCTQYSSYPALFVERIQTDHPAVTIVGARIGVGGWSSHQGLAQLKRDILPLKPLVATIYFGWNDHWMGFGVEDAEIHDLGIEIPGLGEPRLAQLFLKAQLGLRNWRRGDRPLRVPPENFRRNLREMVSLAREGGIVPVLLTAPAAHQRGREPKRISKRFLSDLSQLVPLHQRYVAIVREVAEAEGAALCDLERAFAAIPWAERRSRYFHRDGIHPRPDGDAVTAELLYACFQSEPELRGIWRSTRGG